MDILNLSGEEVQECQAILKSHPLFLFLPLEIINELILKFTKQIYRPTERIVTQNELVNFIGVIELGEAEVKVDDVPVAVLRKNEFIGISSMGFYSTTGKRTATVNALTDLVLFSIDIQSMFDIMHRYPDVYKKFQENDQLILRMNFLKNAAPFSELSFEKLYQLAEKIDEVSLPDKAVLFEQGNVATHCYFIISGHIEISMQNEKGKFYPLFILPPLSIVGETSLLIDTTRGETATAIEDCKLFSLSREDFLSAVKDDEYAMSVLMTITTLSSRPNRVTHIKKYVTQSRDGEEIIILNNTLLKKYFRLTREGFFVFEKLDGNTTIRDITLDLYQKRHVFNPDMVASLIVDLAQSGFVTMPSIKKSEPLKPSKDFSRLGKIKSIMEAKMVIQNVDPWVTKTYDWGIHYLYTFFGKLILFSIAFFGFFCFIATFQKNLLLIKNLHTTSWFLLFISIPILMIVLVFHELAHAYTTKAFNRIVHGFGLGWFWVGPVAYCDTSDMWLSSKRERIMVDLAGFYLQFILAGLASLAAIFISSPSFILILWYFSLFNYLTIISNLSPITERDGYYALMDCLDAPNLKNQALTWLVNGISFKKNFQLEIIYWMICFIYLIFSFLTSYFVSKYVLTGLTGSHNPLYSLFISSVLLMIPCVVLLFDVNRKRLEIKAFNKSK